MNIETLRDIEDHLDKDLKRQEGIYFTPLRWVDRITREFDFSKINRIVDTTAGCGNFLAPLALKHPHIEFYGIEKNADIYRWTRDKLKDLPNLTLFHGDVLRDDFDIPPIDLYLGNPPFLNYPDLAPEDKLLLQDLWPQLFPKDKGFEMLLGKSRGDLAQVIFYWTIRKFLKSGGEFGVVLPSSLIWGSTASRSFREFNGIGIGKLIGFPDAGFFHTDRDSLIVIGKKGEETSYPLLLEQVEGDSRWLEPTAGGQLVQKVMRIFGGNVPISPGKESIPWVPIKCFSLMSFPFSVPFGNPCFAQGISLPLTGNPLDTCLCPTMIKGLY